METQRVSRGESIEIRVQDMSFRTAMITPPPRLEIRSLRNMLKLSLKSKLEFEIVSVSHVSVATITSAEHEIMLLARSSCFGRRLLKFASKNERGRC